MEVLICRWVEGGENLWKLGAVRPGARRGQGSWIDTKEFLHIVPYYTHIRSHGNESLLGTWWWVWSLVMWARSALEPKDLKPNQKCSL